MYTKAETVMESPWVQNIFSTYNTNSFGYIISDKLFGIIISVSTVAVLMFISKLTSFEKINICWLQNRLFKNSDSLKVALSVVNHRRFWQTVSDLMALKIAAQVSRNFVALRVLSGVCIYRWASYQIRKIAGCACAGNAGTVFPATAA